jgi:MYXO-CTERM domain-containing protein
MTRRSFAFVASALAAPALIALTAGPASAHFVLQAPAAYSQQDLLGSPQKSAPCGQDDDPNNPPTLTNAVTTFQAGSTIDITINETVTHPGHYRVSLAPSLEALPEDPTVTPGSTPCGSTVIEQNPVLPLLADGELVHTSGFNGAQTMHVKLPDGMTCDHCTLQVTEFMSNHGLNNPGGCFYHHCATVSVTSGPVPDAGPNDPDASPASGDGGVSNPANDDGGCGCQVGGRSHTSSAALLFGSLFGLVALAMRRRRD